MELRLKPRSPFSLASVIRSHGWIRLAPFAEDDGDTGFRSAMQLDSGRAIDFHVGERNGGVYVSTDAHLEKGEAGKLAETVSWMLGLEQDFSSFYSLCQDEPKLAHVPGEAKGRLLRSPTLFEDVVKTILTTNTSWSGTVRMADALVAAYGEPVNGGGESDAVRAFPTPAALARTEEAKLRTVAGLGYRAPYVLELAQRVDSGELDLDALKDGEQPTEELRKGLRAIKGVGGYASASLLMLLGRYDYLPVDSWARTMVSREWYGGEPVGENEIEAAFAAWGRWKALAYWFWKWNGET